MGSPNQSLYWLPLMNGEFYRDSGKVIPLVMKFSVPGCNEELMMVINLSERMILDYFQKAQSGLGFSTLIVNHAGALIASDNSQLVINYREQGINWSVMADHISGQERREFSGRDSYLINYRNTKVAPWIMVHIQSEKVLLAKLRYEFVFIMGPCTLCVFECGSCLSIIS